jgi:hypothetical protein
MVVKALPWGQGFVAVLQQDADDENGYESYEEAYDGDEEEERTEADLTTTRILFRLYDCRAVGGGGEVILHSSSVIEAKGSALLEHAVYVPSQRTMVVSNGSMVVPNGSMVVPVRQRLLLNQKVTREEESLEEDEKFAGEMWRGEDHGIMPSEGMVEGEDYYDAYEGMRYCGETEGDFPGQDYHLQGGRFKTFTYKPKPVVNTFVIAVDATARVTGRLDLGEAKLDSIKLDSAAEDDSVALEVTLRACHYDTNGSRFDESPHKKTISIGGRAGGSGGAAGLTDTASSHASTPSSLVSAASDLVPCKMRVVDLRAELKRLGLDTTGLKAVLVKRLEDNAGGDVSADARAPKRKATKQKPTAAKGGKRRR